MKLEVTTFSMNERIDTETFNEEEIMKTSQSQYSNVSSSLPLYPVALLGSTLQKEEVSKINDSTNHILQFSGEKSFTLVETVMNKSNSMNVEEIDGEVIALVDGFAYMKGNQMTYISSGVVCSLYSNELSQQEMLSVLSSMQSSSIK